ncbi:MAG: hypothetical protein HY898_22940 [Deltaproteobacteria bacterium]|nr:hypothetical protein [Deltaproteobacteria bacterium]
MNVLIGLLVVGVSLGLYLSVGCVWSSEHLRVFGFPLPWGAWQRSSGGQWFDYVSPWSILFPPINFVLWVGAAVAPITIGEWRRKRGPDLLKRTVHGEEAPKEDGPRGDNEQGGAG